MISNTLQHFQPRRRSGERCADRPRVVRVWGTRPGHAPRADRDLQL